MSSRETWLETMSSGRAGEGAPTTVTRTPTRASTMR